MIGRRVLHSLSAKSHNGATFVRRMGMGNDDITELLPVVL